MINSDYKKTLLLMVNKLADNKEFWSKKKLKEGKLGSSNIRSVANICERADCYEELKLYIHYKIAKGNGWNDEFHKNITFGQVILNDMEAIYNDANCDDEEAIKRIGLYFGYLYWIKNAIEKGCLGGMKNEFIK